MRFIRRSALICGLALSLLFAAGCNTQATTPSDKTTSAPAAPPALNQAPPASQPQPPAPTSGSDTAKAASTPSSSQTGGSQSPADKAPASAPAAKTKGDGTVAATVNGESIGMADYQRESAQARSFLMSDPKFNANSAEGSQALQTISNQVLEQLISEALIRQYATKNNITVSDAELTQSIDALVKDMGGQAEFDKALAARSLTKDAFTVIQRSQLLGNKVRDQVTKDVPQTMEQVHARHILVQSMDEANRALNRLKAGEDFGKVAREMSQDPGTARNNGDLGWFPRGLMVPEFEQVAFSQALNQLSSPVQSQFGYHIIQTLEKQPNRKLPDDRWQELRQAKFQEWLEDQRDIAKIERFVE